MVYALLALGLACVLYLLNTAEHNRRAADLKGELRRQIANLSEELRLEREKTRRFLAMIAAGDPPTPEMIEEGVFWRDASGDEARGLVERDGARVLDVRTDDEVAAGAVPGALHLPIEQLEERAAELPDDGRPLVVYCAAGGRSAAACEFLSQRGYRGALHNLAGGVGAWPGPLERPGA